MPDPREQIIKQLRNTPTSSQEALVKRTIKKTIEPIKMMIPGGKTMNEELDQLGLRNAVFNWLRRVNHYTEVKISFAKDPNAYKLNKRKVMDFTQGKDPVWWSKSFGKAKLAEHLAEVMFEQECVAVEATKEGIFVYEDTQKKFSAESQDWEPYVEFIPKRFEEYKDL